LANTRNTFTAL